MLTMSSSHANANKAVYDACCDDTIAGAGDSALAVVEPASTGSATGTAAGAGDIALAVVEPASMSSTAAATFAFDDMDDPNYNLGP